MDGRSAARGLSSQAVERWASDNVLAPIPLLTESRTPYSSRCQISQHLYAPMFRIIDRYVLRQFVMFYLICFLSLTGLYVVIDAFGKLDHFVDHSKQGGNLFGVMGKYYGFQSLAFFNRTSGILALIAAMFTVTWSQRYNEMTALLAAGVPRLRVLRPVIVAALVITLAAVGVREWLVPSIRYELALDTKNLSGEAQLPLQSRYDNQTDILLGGESMIVAQRTIKHPSFVLPPEYAAHGKQLNAQSAEYIIGQDGGPSGYWLRDVSKPQGLLQHSSLRDANQKVVIASPKDNAWLGPNELFVVSDLSFELLAEGSTWRDFASTRELLRGLKSPSVELGADVNVAVHRRMLSPMLDMTLLMLGLPLVVSRGARNPFIAIGLCLAVVVAFFVVLIGSQSLGSTGWLPPALAAWMPLIVFVPVAVGLSDPLRK